ncbi:MAG TPA: carboxypeptidase regulatory-like domain-containing protein [Bryobacteraceae bacterium]|nr:carboxypeptidase regulatory-like domain-containing protein [Bryobacteraceae bacterium]
MPRALKFCLLIASSLVIAPGQDVPPPAISPPPTTQPPEVEAPGAIQGTVLSGASGQALRRAQVVLKPADSKNAALYQTTDESGAFAFPKVTPGRYVITVERDGYLPLSAGRIGDYKMPPIFTVNSGETIGSFVYRLTPSGVVSGKVKFDDAEPAVNVAIQLYRSYYERGRHGYAAAANARTDDRGEYRVHGLEPGTYFVAALYQAPPRPANAEEETRKDALGNPLPELSYAVTFFPQAQKLSDAVAVNITPGGEVPGIDIFLTLVHTVHIRGRVLSAAKGGVIPNPSVTLRMNDSDNTASVSAPINITLDKDQDFDIQGVTAGPYLLLASGAEDGVTLTGRVPINIGDADVSNANVVVSPENLWNGKVHVDDDDSTVPPGLTISLQPRRTTAPVSQAKVSDSGEFVIPFVPEEIYDLYVLNGPDNSYLKSVRIGNSERLGQGLEASSGDPPPALDVRLGSQGGQVIGRAVTADPKVVASGAVVALIPDPPAGRVQTYQTTHADEYGNFQLKGLPPGTYVVVAWLDSAPCEIYDPDDLATCRAQGSSLTIEAAEQQSVQLTAN